MTINLCSYRVILLLMNASFTTCARALNGRVRRLIIALVGLATRLVRALYEVVLVAGCRRTRSMVRSV